MRSPLFYPPNAGLSRSGNGSPDLPWLAGRATLGRVDYANHYFDDWKFPLMQTKIGANLKPDWDEVNVGFLFPQNDASEILYAADQSSHKINTEVPMGPHIHWRQTQAGEPVFKIGYKLFDNGDEEPADFTVITSTGNVFPYVSGNISQISSFDDIDISVFDGISTQLILKIWRDDNVYPGDVCARSCDFHMAFIRPGSENPYS